MTDQWSETAKAILRGIFRLVRVAAGATIASINTTDGLNALSRPYVWLGIIIAVEPIVTEMLAPARITNVATAAKIDDRIEAKAAEQTEKRVRSLFMQGVTDPRKNSRE